MKPLQPTRRRKPTIGHQTKYEDTSSSSESEDEESNERRRRQEREKRRSRVLQRKLSYDHASDSISRNIDRKTNSRSSSRTVRKDSFGKFLEHLFNTIYF